MKQARNLIGDVEEVLASLCDQLGDASRRQSWGKRVVLLFSDDD